MYYESLLFLLAFSVDNYLNNIKESGELRNFWHIFIRVNTHTNINTLHIHPTAYTIFAYNFHLYFISILYYKPKQITILTYGSYI